jgi:hypothetical protein
MLSKRAALLSVLFIPLPIFVFAQSPSARRDLGSRVASLLSTPALPPVLAISPLNQRRARSSANLGREDLRSAGASFSPASINSIFRTAPAYNSGGYESDSVVLADVNGDGKLDLVVGNDCPSVSTCNSGGSVSVLLGNGDGTFQAAVTYALGGSDALSVSVAVADVNADGKPDLLATSEGSDTVGVLLGNGDGTFQAAVNYSSGGLDPSFVAVKDVNGDGKPDLLVANICAFSCSGIGVVGVLLGNGDGTFQAPVSYNSGGYNADSVAVADVNGDGRPDLVVANECDNDGHCMKGLVGVLLGNGDGTFQAAVSYPSGESYAVSIAVADVNGDGKPDLLVANLCAAVVADCAYGGTGSIGVLLGNGDGTFQAAVNYDSGGENANSIVVADVNGDGKLDLLVSNGDPLSLSGGGVVGILLGNGDGTFQVAVVYSTGGDGAASLAVGDVNGDDKLDLVVANGCNVGTICSNGVLGVVLSDGGGSFQAAPNYDSGGYIATSTAVADVNGDGKLDVIVANQCATFANCPSASNGSVAGVLLGKGNGTFRAVVGYPAGGYEAESIAVADVNGDGKLDLLVANYCGTAPNSSNNCLSSGVVGVLLGNGDGTFQTAKAYASGYFPAYIAVADVNGDGKPDLLVANNCASSDCSNDNGLVSVLLGNGDGSFQSAKTYGTGGANAQAIAVADVNGDGKPDLLVANYCSGSCPYPGVVAVLLGNGDGTFQSAVTYNSGGYEADSLAVADVNGDGKLDLVVANVCASSSNCSLGSSSTTGALGVLFGNGDGTFQGAIVTIVPGYIGLGQLALGDFNGDRKLDVASGGGDFLAFGNGDGTFQTPLSLGAGGGAIAAGDFNRDGRPDLAVGGLTSSSIFCRACPPQPPWLPLSILL